MHTFMPALYSKSLSSHLHRVLLVLLVLLVLKARTVLVVFVVTLVPLDPLESRVWLAQLVLLEIRDLPERAALL